MKRIVATRFLILALLFGAVLSLPGGLLAATGAPSPGCSHCQSAGPGLSSGCCCCLPGTPGHCGSSGQSRGFTCRCASGGPVFFSPAVTTIPTWPASSYMPVMVNVSSKLFPPSIFHPPELQPFSAPI